MTAQIAKRSSFANPCLGIIRLECCKGLKYSKCQIIISGIISSSRFTYKLKPFRNALKGVVIESTFNWYWLVDGLMEAGYRVHLANPAAIKQYTGLKYSDDNSDALWLAEMLRLSILPEGYIFEKQELSEIC